MSTMSHVYTIKLNFTILLMHIPSVAVYKIQLDAPTPQAIHRRLDIPDAVDFYGYEYHGLMDHKMSESLLQTAVDGSYLIRQSPGASTDDFYTLSLRFNNRTKHFKIYYTLGKGHFLHTEFKRFDTIHDLVADGLVNFYMQIHAVPIMQAMMAQTRNCYQQSPYMTLNRRKLRALSNDLRKSLKYGDGTTGSNDDTTDEFCKKDGEGKDAKNSIIPSSSSQEDLDVLPIIYEKSHNFKVHTFKGNSYEILCENNRIIPTFHRAQLVRVLC